MFVMKPWHCRNACNENVALQECLQRNRGTAGIFATKPWHCRNACNESVALQECLQRNRALQECLQRNRGTAGMLATKPWYCRNVCNETVALQECLQRNRGTAEMFAIKPWHCRNVCNETVALEEPLHWTMALDEKTRPEGMVSTKPSIVLTNRCLLHSCSSTEIKSIESPLRYHNRNYTHTCCTERQKDCLRTAF